MKKLLVVLVLVLVPGLAFAQVNGTGTYFVDYYANNGGVAGASDAVVRIINVGTQGSPLDAPTGNICANVYVFDADQEMIACCAAYLTPNEMDAAWVGRHLTYNPLNGFVPQSGVIKIVLTPNNGSFSCNATRTFTGADASLGKVWATHIQQPPAANFLYITETESRASTLGTNEASFLPQTCSFVRYLGSNLTGFCQVFVSTGLR
jgi:hypothetical protein